jgi:signal transduction histidine kinase
LRQQIELMKRHIDRELMRARTSGAIAAGSVLTDVQKTVDRLIDLIRRMPRGDDIAWENDLPSGLRFRMDPDDFGEIIGNLLDNARKWAKSRVRISAEIRGDAVRFYVDDDGPGIPREARDEIIKRGERAGEAEGTGLGLAIAIRCTVSVWRVARNCRRAARRLPREFRHPRLDRSTAAFRSSIEQRASRRERLT